MFTYALGISILIHAVVLAIRFHPIDLQKMFDRGPPLEVALVNAKSTTKPTKADILAQANLDGGGNTDADRRAKTPLPVLPKDSQTAEITVATQKVQTLEQETKELMTRLQSTPTAPSTLRSTAASEPADLPTSSELMQRTLEAMRLEAQIAKDMDAYQKRPKRRFIGARAEEYRFARYVEDWRLKIERIGNQNYPEAARAAEALRQPAAHGVDSRRRQHRERFGQPLVRPSRARRRRRAHRRDVGAVRPVSPRRQARHGHPAYHADVDVHQG